jgi:hypothetical protein
LYFSFVVSRTKQRLETKHVLGTWWRDSRVCTFERRRAVTVPCFSSVSFFCHLCYLFVGLCLNVCVSGIECSTCQRLCGTLVQQGCWKLRSDLRLYDAGGQSNYLSDFEGLVWQPIWEKYFIFLVVIKSNSYDIKYKKKKNLYRKKNCIVVVFLFK